MLPVTATEEALVLAFALLHPSSSIVFIHTKFFIALGEREGLGLVWNLNHAQNLLIHSFIGCK